MRSFIFFRNGPSNNQLGEGFDNQNEAMADADVLFQDGNCIRRPLIVQADADGVIRNIWTNRRKVNGHYPDLIGHNISEYVC